MPRPADRAEEYGLSVTLDRREVRLIIGIAGLEERPRYGDRYRERPGRLLQSGTVTGSRGSGVRSWCGFVSGAVAPVHRDALAVATIPRDHRPDICSPVQYVAGRQVSYGLLWTHTRRPQARTYRVGLAWDLEEPRVRGLGFAVRFEVDSRAAASR